MKTLPKKTKEEGSISNSFYDTSIILIPTLDKEISKKRRAYKLISLMNIDTKKFKKSKLNLAMQKILIMKHILEENTNVNLHDYMCLHDQ